jgi:hypothetical protein
VAEAGPSYATKREEAAESMTAIAIQNPDFLARAGDIFFKTMDFPGSEELAERYRNAIPPELLGEGPSPAEQQLQQQLQDTQQQMQNTQSQLSSAIQALADQSRKLDNDDKQTEIKSYQAMTDRMNDFFTRMEALGAPPELAAMQAQTMLAANQQPEPFTEPPQPAPQVQPAPPMGGIPPNQPQQ